MKRVQECKRRLKSKLDIWLKDVDIATYPEDKTETDFWEKQMAKAEKGWKTRRGFSVDVSDEEYLKWWEKELKK